MADATDLKSVPVKTGYGFESHHRHLEKRDFTREKRQSDDANEAHASARKITLEICLKLAVVGSRQTS